MLDAATAVDGLHAGLPRAGRRSAGRRDGKRRRARSRSRQRAGGRNARQHRGAAASAHAPAGQKRRRLARRQHRGRARRARGRQRGPRISTMPSTPRSIGCADEHPAPTRGDVATYVDALILVYLILIFVNVLLSWIQQFRPLPYSPPPASRDRVRRGHDQPISQRLPRLHSPDRSARHQPDRRDPGALDSRWARRQRDPRVSTARTRAWLKMLALGGVVVALDQVVKAAIVASLDPEERIGLALGFELVRVTNDGIAFGLLDEGGEGLVLAITLVALALVLGLVRRRRTRPWQWLGVGLLVGGALGNLDRPPAPRRGHRLLRSSAVAGVQRRRRRDHRRGHRDRGCRLQRPGRAAASRRVAVMPAQPRLVHTDEWLAVIEKPPGLVVHPAPGQCGSRPSSTCSPTCSAAARPAALGSSTGSIATPPG